MNIWAVGDLERANPVSGDIFELHAQNKKIPTDIYKAKNYLWDFSEGEINLKGARNEFVVFQIIIRRGKFL